MEHNKTSNPSSEPENLFNITKICVGLIMLCPWRPLPLRAVYVHNICRVKEKAVIEFKVSVLSFFLISFTFLLCLMWSPPGGSPSVLDYMSGVSEVARVAPFQRHYTAGAQSCSGLLKTYFPETSTKLECNQGVCAACVSGRQLLQPAPHLCLCLCFLCFVCFSLFQSPTNPGLFSFSAALINQ